MYDFDALKTRMRDYLSEEFNIRNVRRNFACPICGSGHKTPCASYDPRTDRIKCFSCGWNGDIIDLCGKIENITPAEAARRLSERFDHAPIHKPTSSAKTAVEGAQTPPNFKEYIERCASDEHAANYFKARGITQPVITTFRLGFDNVEQVAVIPYNEHFYIGRYLNPTAGKYKRVSGVTKSEPFNAAALLQDTSAPVWITEGEINALSIESLSLQAVAIGSSSDWRVLVNYLDTHGGTKRPLIVFLDNDEAGQAAQAELCAALADREIRFKNATCDALNHNYDINDALMNDPDGLKEVLQGMEKEFINEINKNLTTFNNEGTTGAPLRKTLVYSGTDILQRFITKIQSADFRPIPTGFPMLDSKLGGGLFSGLVILSAAPSEGKTTLAMQLCETIAEQQERDVLVFSFEMSREQLVAKTVSRLTYEAANQNPACALTALEFMKGYEWDKLEGAKLSTLEAVLARYREKIGSRIYIFDDATPTLNGIMEKIAWYRANVPTKEKAPIVLIDYLQLLDVEGKEFVAGCKDITLALKKYAIEQDTLVFAVSAVNRDSQRSGASLTSSYGSSFAEYSADYMFTLDFRAIKNGWDVKKEELKQKPVREMALTIQKNRMGETGATVDFYYAAAHNHFTDRPTEQQLADAVKGIENRKGGVIR